MCSGPRGNGAVSIADLAFRWGAISVLGTLVPIDAIHNQFVVMRVLLYAIESIHRREAHLTFADVACAPL